MQLPDEIPQTRRRRVIALLGFLGVALGAFGAHGLKGILAAHSTAAVWQTAVFYQLIHVAAALWAAERHPRVVWTWILGVLFFSGSLYLLALTNLRWLGAITPVGGVLFLAGWGILLVSKK